jgi:hypothetical protein
MSFLQIRRRHLGKKLCIDQALDIAVPHVRHFLQMRKFPYHLRRNVIEVRPNLCRQASAWRWNLFRVVVPTLLKLALDDLVGF